jgi:hypothetical protein
MKLVIQVFGGCVQACYVTPGTDIDLMLVDADNMGRDKAEEALKREIEGLSVIHPDTPEDDDQRVFELMLPGFVGDGTTDDKILWLATSEEDLKAVIGQAMFDQSANDIGALEEYDLADVDFVLPDGADDLRAKLREASGE